MLESETSKFLYYAQMALCLKVAKFPYFHVTAPIDRYMWFVRFPLFPIATTNYHDNKKTAFFVFFFVFWPLFFNNLTILFYLFIQYAFLPCIV